MEKSMANYGTVSTTFNTAGLTTFRICYDLWKHPQVLIASLFFELLQTLLEYKSLKSSEIILDENGWKRNLELKALDDLQHLFGITF